jgi:hypothetical protein
MILLIFIIDFLIKLNINLLNHLASAVSELEFRPTLKCLKERNS